MSVEVWLSLSVVLNLGLIAWMLGAASGRKLAEPIRELTIQLRESSARLEERAKWLDDL